MPNILRQLPLTEDVNNALLGKSGEFNHYITLAKAFESAIWLNVIKQSKELNIDQKHLHSLYNQAVVWGNGVRKTISAYFPRTKVQ